MDVPNGQQLILMRSAGTLNQRMAKPMTAKKAHGTDGQVVKKIDRTLVACRRENVSKARAPDRQSL